MSSDSLNYSADDYVDNRSHWSESPLAWLDVDSLSPHAQTKRKMHLSPSITSHDALPHEADVDTFGFFPAVLVEGPEMQQLSPKGTATSLAPSPFEIHHGRHQSDDSTVFNNFGFNLSRSSNTSKSFHHRNYTSVLHHI